MVLDYRFLSEVEFQRCGKSNRLSLVKSVKKTRPVCTRDCCKHCPDEGEIHEKCKQPIDPNHNWDEGMNCGEWKHIEGYHLWGYTWGVHSIY